MKNRKKLNMLNFIFFVVAIGFVVLSIIFKTNQALMLTFISIAFLFFIMTVIIEKMIKNIDKEHEQMLEKEWEKEKQEAFLKVEEYSSFSERFSLLNSLIKNEIIEIDFLVKKYNLKYDFDFVFEDKYYDFIIEGSISKRKNFYLSFSTENDHWTLILNNTNKDIVLKNETNKEIIDLIVNDINESFNKN